MRNKCSSCGKKTTDFPSKGRRPDGTQIFRATCKDCYNQSKRVGGGAVDISTGEPAVVEDLIKEHRRDIELKKLRTERFKLIESLAEAERRQAVLNEFEAAKLSGKVFRRETESGKREAVAVVQCSDWHVEEPVESEKVNGLNEYSLEIADKRIQRLADGILWLLDMHGSKFEITNLVLALQGDFMSGFIHEDLIETNELTPVETILWLQDRIIGLIDHLLTETDLEKIICPCNSGNHGRTGKTTRVQTNAESSYEWLMYQQLARHYAGNERVEIFAPKSQLVYLDVYDYILRFTHGDAVNYGGGVGGISVPLLKAAIGWDQGAPAAMTYVGHFHQLLHLQNVTCNGSLIGYAPYSVRIKAGFEKPQQSFQLIDSRHGPCCKTGIWVDGSDSIDASSK